MALTLSEANQMIEAAIAKAQSLDIRIVVAVCDSGGRLVAFQRMDGAFMAAAIGAQGKAVAAAAFGRPSRELAKIANGPLVGTIAAIEGAHMVPSEGAFPIVATASLRAPWEWPVPPTSKTNNARWPAWR